MLAKKILKKESGFTLIELLIVIAIIVILTILLFVSFTQVQKNARDAQRKSDLQTIAAALQRFYSDNSQYPPEDNLVNNTGKSIGYNDSTCNGAITKAAQLGNDSIIGNKTLGIICNSTTYIKEIPKDPLNTGNYQYCYETTSAANQGFRVYAVMENSSNAMSGVSSNCNWGGSGIYNYRVTAQD